MKKETSVLSLDAMLCCAVMVSRVSNCGPKITSSFLCSLCCQLHCTKVYCIVQRQNSI